MDESHATSRGAAGPWAADQLAIMRTKAFDELRAIWTRFGRPSPLVMASRVGVPPARFDFLTRQSTDLPDISHVRDLLRAVGESSKVINRWERTWQYLKTSEDNITATPGPPNGMPDQDGPLGKALKASTPEEFVAQLQALKSRAHMSFDGIARASNNRLPKSTSHWMLQRGNFPARPEQVRLFVEACGANSAEAELWLTAYARAQGRYRVQVTVDSSSPAAGNDLPVFLERVGDDLAAQGRLREAITAYKEALAHQRSASDASASAAKS